LFILFYEEKILLDEKKMRRNRILKSCVFCLKGKIQKIFCSFWIFLRFSFTIRWTLSCESVYVTNFPKTSMMPKNRIFLSMLRKFLSTYLIKWFFVFCVHRHKEIMENFENHFQLLGCHEVKNEIIKSRYRTTIRWQTFECYPVKSL